MIYFIQAGDEGPIKIGYTLGTDNFKHRFRMLQTGNHEELRLLKLVEGSKRDEESLHLQFHHLQYRAGSEWFYDSQQIRDLIERLGMFCHTIEPPDSGAIKLWTT